MCALVSPQMRVGAVIPIVTTDTVPLHSLGICTRAQTPRKLLNAPAPVARWVINGMGSDKGMQEWSSNSGTRATWVLGSGMLCRPWDRHLLYCRSKHCPVDVSCPVLICKGFLAGCVELNLVPEIYVYVVRAE